MPSPPPPSAAATPEATFNPTSLTTTPPIQTPITFLFHITLVLLSLAALYVLSTVPRALAALGQPQAVLLRAAPPAHRRAPSSSSSASSRRRYGHAPTASPSSPPTAYPRKAAEALHREASGHSAGTDESHTLHSHAQLVLPRAGSGSSRRAGRDRGKVKYSPPTRVPHWATLVHPLLAALLAWRVTPRLSVAQVGVLGAYAGVWAYGGLYRSNPLSDPLRTGYLALSQIPIVVALACKNNVLGVLAGVGYEKLNYIHRFTGRLLVIAVNVHGLGYLYSHALASPPTLTSFLRIPHIAWGLVSLVAVDAMALTSLSAVRNRRGRLWYSLFLGTHVVGFALFLGGLALHTIPPTPHPSLITPYILTPLLLYALDHGLRLARTRLARARLHALPALNGGTTRVAVPALGAGWRAGQHVRLRVVGAGSGSSVWAVLGAWAMGRARPFTVASAPGGGGMELLVKSGGRGLWTGWVFDVARGDDGGVGGGGEKEKGEGEVSNWERAVGEKGRVVGISKGKVGTESDLESGGFPASRKVRVLVEGPYGGPNHALFASYSGALLVAGGSGISYVLGILDDLLLRHAEGRSRLRVIEVIWVVRDASSLTSLLPTLAPLLRPRPSPHAALHLRFTAHYTRAALSSSSSSSSTPKLPLGVHMRSARPDLLMSLEGTVDAVLSAHTYTHARRSSLSSTGAGEEWPSGVVVGVCGPAEMGAEVAQAVSGVGWGRWRDVGGVEVVEE
ncbi:hypothetical protein DENSPDRAFT_919417 [Dentipellis sp. KUC8613]|nr:hypothetical protein DENSPDRAFT_919417 [Dentipellis sp. KUC8613]